MDRNFVILAGGISSRMRSAMMPSLVGTTPTMDVVTGPKGMIRVGKGNRPFLDYLLFNIEQAGYERVVFVVGERDDSIRHYYDHDGGAAQFPHLTFDYAVQTIPKGFEKPLGTAEGLLQALRAKESWRGRRFTVCNSDNLYSQRALRMLLEDTHENALIDYERSGLQYGNERIAQWAVTIRDGEGFLTDIIEKPSESEILRLNETQGNVGVSMNVWRFSYDDILPYLEAVPLHPVRKEKDLNAAVKMMVTHRRHCLYAIALSEHVIDLTSRVDIPAVDKYVREQFPNL